MKILFTTLVQFHNCTISISYSDLLYIQYGAGRYYRTIRNFYCTIPGNIVQYTMHQGRRTYGTRASFDTRKSNFGTAFFETLNQDTVRLHKLHEFTLVDFD